MRLAAERRRVVVNAWLYTRPTMCAWHLIWTSFTSTDQVISLSLDTCTRSFARAYLPHNSFAHTRAHFAANIKYRCLYVQQKSFTQKARRHFTDFFFRCFSTSTIPVPSTHADSSRRKFLVFVLLWRLAREWPCSSLV